MNIYIYIFLICVISVETVCEREIPNGDIAGSCGIHVDDSCDDFTCDYGYRETLGVGTFNCTESGHWDYNLSLLCTGKDISIIGK